MPKTKKPKKENGAPKLPKRTQPNGRPIFDEKYNLKNRTPEERKRQWRLAEKMCLLLWIKRVKPPRNRNRELNKYPLEKILKICYNYNV